MPSRMNVYNPLRQDPRAALREIELMEQEFTEVSQREARRMTYRPPTTYVRITPIVFAYAFTMFFGAIAALLWLGKAEGWWWK